MASPLLNTTEGVVGMDNWTLWGWCLGFDDGFLSRAESASPGPVGREEGLGRLARSSGTGAKASFAWLALGMALALLAAAQLVILASDVPPTAPRQAHRLVTQDPVLMNHRDLADPAEGPLPAPPFGRTSPSASSHRLVP